MTRQPLQQAVDLARQQSHVWIATADREGRPHMTTAAELRLEDAERLVVRGWFCPSTVENVRECPAVAIVVWPGGEEEGFQLLGRVAELRSHEMMDGYDPTLTREPPLPQEQRDMVVTVEDVLRFRHGPHSDEPEDM